MKKSCYCAQHCVRAILELFIHSLILFFKEKADKRNFWQK